MIPSSQKKPLHSLLSTNLKHLTITPPSSSSSTGAAAASEFDFSDVFGPPPPLTPHPRAPSTSASPSSSRDPPVIHNRSHSFVGPSPRYTTAPPSLPFLIQEEEEEEVDLEQNDVVLISESENAETSIRSSSSSVTTSTVTTAAAGGGGGGGGGEGQNGKLGPGDFEIMRVVGRGAFGKVFQVRMREKRRESEGSHGGGGGDGVYAMKVMRKDSIIRKKHVDYMKAERDILTKVVHPFVVQLRFSFQVPLFSFSLILRWGILDWFCSFLPLL